MIRDIWEFPGRAVGNRVVVYSSTDSTNTRAAEHAGQPGLAFLADVQTAGRGQHSRTWLARPGASVLLSVLVAPPAALCRPALLTAWAAVAVCETARRLTGTEPRIKWPNDVLLGGRKVAGILTEQLRPGEVVAGIGLNVCQTRGEFDGAGLPQATSLHDCGSDARTETVAQLLLESLDGEYRRLIAGDVAFLEQRWSRGFGLIGCEVELEWAGGVERGRLIDLGFDGVVLEKPAAPLLVAPEAVRHLTAVGPGATAEG